ncbi:hypothetical protein AYM40_35505 [Paraburkholderia phytofirmans OLGA172]|uniref:Uncharacterized protein n=1 Tax=Paraburkholderia phytofirmans OLGA172 TaxID=1417228 RepID=A0A160FW13_9BURK|nr:hypothetical protein AYM40_35505 [Paraburkholderia phytofirmans OLGA172]
MGGSISEISSYALTAGRVGFFNAWSVDQRQSGLKLARMRLSNERGERAARLLLTEPVSAHGCVRARWTTAMTGMFEPTP